MCIFNSFSPDLLFILIYINITIININCCIHTDWWWQKYHVGCRSSWVMDFALSSSRTRSAFYCNWSLVVLHVDNKVCSLSDRKTDIWYYDWAYHWEELINFYWWYDPGYGSHIPFPLTSPRCITDKLQCVLNAAVHLVTDTCKLDHGLFTCCMGNCTGSTSQNVYTTNWESHCIAVCRTRSQSTWWTAVHQSQTFPADVIYGQPLDITWPYHVISSALSVVGPSMSQVRRFGTCYRTVSVTRHSPATASDNCWKRIYFVVTTQHTQRSRDSSRLCAVEIYYWHWQCRIRRLGDLLAFLVQLLAAFHDTWTDAYERLNPLHFGSDPADTQIEIGISPEMWINIWINFGCSRRVRCSWCW